MQPSRYIWKNGQLIPWEQATTHVLSHALHYGSGVFEGIRCYETELGPAVFKLDAHIARLLYSASSIGIQTPFDAEALKQATLETLQANGLQEAYIRPLIYYGYGSIRVIPKANTPIDCVIACWPGEQYMESKLLKVVISDTVRMHPSSTVTDAKICGNYVNSVIAGLATHYQDFDEVILLDHQGYIAEGTAQNIFMIKDQHLFTPSVGNIIEGITRNLIIEIAKQGGYTVSETQISPAMLLEADEIFYCGTASEIRPVQSVNQTQIGPGKPGPITSWLQKRYAEIVRGQDPTYHAMLTQVQATSPLLKQS